MKAFFRSRVVRAAIVVGALALLVHAVVRADLTAAADLLAGAGPATLLVPLPFLAAMALEAIAWRQSLRALGHERRLRSIVALRVAGEAVPLTVPGGSLAAEPVKIHLVASRAGVPACDAVACVAAQKWFVVTTHAVLLAGALALSFTLPFIGAEVRWMLAGSTAALAIAAIVLHVSITRAAPAVRILALLRKLPSRSLSEKLAARAAAFERTDASLARAIGTPRSAATALVATLGGWIVETLESFLILRILGVSIDLGAVLAIEAIVSIVRAAAFFVPRGLGLSDTSHVTLVGAAAGGDAAAAGAALVLLKRAKEAIWAAVGWWLFLRGGRLAQGAVV